MHTLKLYCTLEDLNAYICQRIDEKYKNSTFLPVKVDFNDLDFSIELTLVSADDPDENNLCRYKLEVK